MPVLTEPRYRPPLLLRSGHVQTIVPTLFRRLSLPTPTRERLELRDGDFMDLDHYRTGSERVLLLFHGLESCSEAPYMLGMANAALQAGMDAIAVNFRGCSGEPNRLLRSYHSGSSDDVDAVVQAALGSGRYRRIDAVGFSLGGNILLNYLGDGRHTLPDAFGAGVAIASPIDLSGSVLRTEWLQNRIYRNRFIGNMVQKVLAKRDRFAGEMDFDAIARCRSFLAFDDMYTARVNGFADADDYWTRCSSLRVLADVRRPVLILNALDDPLLSEKCYPTDIAADSPDIHLQTPRHGGHLGFLGGPMSGTLWHEHRSMQFFQRLSKCSLKN